jgi:hypothetical protein
MTTTPEAVGRDAAAIIRAVDTGDLHGAVDVLNTMDRTELCNALVLLAGLTTTAATEPQTFARWLAEHTPDMEVSS